MTLCYKTFLYAFIAKFCSTKEGLLYAQLSFNIGVVLMKPSGNPQERIGQLRLLNDQDWVYRPTLQESVPKYWFKKRKEKDINFID